MHYGKVRYLNEEYFYYLKIFEQYYFKINITTHNFHTIFYLKKNKINSEPFRKVGP